MAVKVADRSLARQAPLQKARALYSQVLLLTRPSEKLPDGNVSKAGILGVGQAYHAYGYSLLMMTKDVYYNCHRASLIYVKNKDTYDECAALLRQADYYCSRMLAELDFCLFNFGTSDKKRKSIKYLIKLTYSTKETINLRLECNKSFIR